MQSYLPNKKNKRKVIKYILFLTLLYIPFELTLGSLITSKVSAAASSFVNGQIEKDKQLIAFQSENGTEYTEVYSGNLILGINSNAPTSNRNRYTTADKRVLAMKQFLKDYNSPMYPYAETFVMQADKYNLDWRLIASITGVESAFGNLIPYHPDIGTSYNAWGWSAATHPETGERWSYFKDWNEGITAITKGMSEVYGTGDLDPYQIVDTYCPPCGAAPGKPWARAVTGYMNELSYYESNIDVL